MKQDGSFIKCEVCGKKLIQRLPNGLWSFKFGKTNEGTPLIDMTIYGSMKMKCIRRECGHMNTLNFFPNTFATQAESKD